MMQEQRSACDACRRRKVGCDSAQPCRRCIEGGLKCTYGSRLRRVPASAYVRSLEQQVAELQHQLEVAENAAPSMPSATATVTPTVTPDFSFRLGHNSHALRQPIDLIVNVGDDLVVQQPGGNRIYRFSAALNLLKTIADMLTTGLTPGSIPASPGLAMVEAIDPPLKLPVHGTVDWLDVVLPSKAELQHLISYALDRALVCHQCIDPQNFALRIDELYNTGSSSVVAKNKSFMALVYAALALGERYYAENEGKIDPLADADNFPSGFQYFRASRCITHADLEPCDLDHVVARILQARYLFSISYISEAHSTICKGISVATHMGMHFDDSALHTSFTSQELDERRRVLAVLYMMDTYTSFILGVPRTLSYANPKQTLGLPSNDLHNGGRDLLTREPFTPLAETVMAERMFHIYAKILDHQSRGDVEAWITSDWIAEIQRDFEDWEAMLPNLPDDSSAGRQLLGQLTLRMHYSGAQILLYAPCIHHLSRERSEPNFNIDGFTYGSDCVRAAAQAVLLVEILQTQNLLSGATWMNGFILTLAASVLTYFVVCSKTRVTVDESKVAIVKAGRMLTALGQASEANRRVYDSLSPYMDIVQGA